MALFRADRIYICTTLVLSSPRAGNIFSEKTSPQAKRHTSHHFTSFLFTSFHFYVYSNFFLQTQNWNSKSYRSEVSPKETLLDPTPEGEWNEYHHHIIVRIIVIIIIIIRIIIIIIIIISLLICYFFLAYLKSMVYFTPWQSFCWTYQRIQTFFDESGKN